MDSFWAMVTIVGGLGTAIPLSILWIQHRQKMAGFERDERSERLIEENSRMEQRMRTLERIVADKGFDVARQIENLRGNDVPLAADKDEAVN